MINVPFEDWSSVCIHCMNYIDPSLVWNYCFSICWFAVLDVNVSLEHLWSCMCVLLRKWRKFIILNLIHVCYVAFHFRGIRHHDDIWTEIAKYLDGKSLVMLAATSKWFYGVIMEESVWKFACLRDLQVPDCSRTMFKWIDLYASAFGKHRTSY